MVLCLLKNLFTELLFIKSKQIRIELVTRLVHDQSNAKFNCKLCNAPFYKQSDMEVHIKSGCTKNLYQKQPKIEPVDVSEQSLPLKSVATAEKNDIKSDRRQSVDSAKPKLDSKVDHSSNKKKESKNTKDLKNSSEKHSKESGSKSKNKHESKKEQVVQKTSREANGTDLVKSQAEAQKAKTEQTNDLISRANIKMKLSTKKDDHSNEKTREKSLSSSSNSLEGSKNKKKNEDKEKLTSSKSEETKKEYKCTLCSEKFRKNKYLVSHMKAEHQIPPNIMKNPYFKEQANPSDNSQTVQPSEEKVKPTQKGDKENVPHQNPAVSLPPKKNVQVGCFECVASFESQKELDSHLESHRSVH